MILLKVNGLIYAELVADMKERYAQTMLVWSGRELSEFNKQGAHNWTRRFFGWVLLGAYVRFYSLNWKADGKIPTAEDVHKLLLQHGKQFQGGSLVGKASRPA